MRRASGTAAPLALQPQPHQVRCSWGQAARHRSCRLSCRPARGPTRHDVVSRATLLCVLWSPPMQAPHPPSRCPPSPACCLLPPTAQAPPLPAPQKARPPLCRPSPATPPRRPPASRSLPPTGRPAAATRRCRLRPPLTSSSSRRGRAAGAPRRRSAANGTARGSSQMPTPPTVRPPGGVQLGGACREGHAGRSLRRGLWRLDQTEAGPTLVV